MENSNTAKKKTKTKRKEKKTKSTHQHLLFQFTKYKRDIHQALLSKPNNNQIQKAEKHIKQFDQIQQQQQTPWNKKSNQNTNNPLIHKKKLAQMKKYHEINN